MADPAPIPPPPPSYVEISEDLEEMQEHQVVELPIDDESEDEHDLLEEQDPEVPINDDAIAREGEESDEYEDDNDDDDDDDEAEIDPDYAVFLAQQFTSGFPRSAFQKSGGTGSRAEAVEGGERRRRIGGPSTSTASGVGSYRGSELNQSEVDGLFCPICLEAWTTDGTHRICCLPCGHIYGMTCVAIWVLRKGKCPQCNQKCKLKDVRRLYASQLISVDEQSQKTIQALEDKCAALEEKVADCHKKEAERLKREAALTLKVEELTKRCMEEGMDCIQAELSQQQPDVLLEQQLPDAGRSVEVLDNMLGRCPGTIILGVRDTMVRDLRSGSSSSSWGANQQSLAFAELRSNVMNLQSDMTNLKSTLQGVIQVLIANGMSIPPQLLQLAQQQPDQQPDHHPV